MSILITTNEAALRFIELLDEVEEHGETVLITRNGKQVAQLAAPPDQPQATLNGLVKKLLALRTGDPAFAEELDFSKATEDP